MTPTESKHLAAVAKDAADSLEGGPWWTADELELERFVQAEFMAAASPAAVLALFEEIRSLIVERDHLRAKLDLECRGCGFCSECGKLS